MAGSRESVAENRLAITVELSNEQARHLLTRYHFAPTDLPGVFTRLGTVQYDPLNPVGRNPDLVLQARVPGYRVDGWQVLAYEQRLRNFITFSPSMTTRLG